MNYKRPRYQQDKDFHAPSPDCFCCYDSGIVTNGDGLVNDYFPDYDMQVVNGKTIHVAGSDAALVCYCKVVYQQQDDTGKTVKEWMRDLDGNAKQHDTAGGDRFTGACITKEMCNDIHARRRDSWKATLTTMNSYRQQAAAGLKPETPEAIANIKQQLQNIGDMFASL